MNWPLTLAFGLGLAFLIWFAVGTQWNVAKGHRVLRWLQSGLPLISERTTLRWYGSSAVQLNMAKAKDPFREVEVVIVLEPRDVVFLWLLGRLRGRHDLMIFRGRLRRPPRFELELADPLTWTGREALGRMQRSAWSEIHPFPSPLSPIRGGEGGEGGLTLLYQGSEASDHAAEFLSRLRQVTPALARLSLRRSDPTQFQIHIGLPDIKQADAHQLFRTFIKIAQDAIERD